MRVKQRNIWGELGQLPAARMPSNPIIADLYADLPVECCELRDSLLSGSDFLGVRLYFNEPNETIGEERPALHLKCLYGLYEPGNPGWHKLALKGYSEGKEPVMEELLWHKDNLKYRSGLLAKIREMANQMAGIK